MRRPTITLSLITKIGAAIITVAAVVTAWGTLTHMTRKPPVLALFSGRPQMISPQMRDLWRRRIEREELLTAIARGESEGLAPEEVLQRTKFVLTNRVVNGVDLEKAALEKLSLQIFADMCWLVEVRNRSANVVEDVRIHVTGSGRADISAYPEPLFNLANPGVVYNQEIAIGSIPGGGTVWLFVWPEGLTSTFRRPKFGVTYRGGEGETREYREFSAGIRILCIGSCNNRRSFDTLPPQSRSSSLSAHFMRHGVSVIAAAGRSRNH